MQLSRSTGAIFAGSLTPNHLTVEEYFYDLVERILPSSKWIHAGAFALEICPTTKKPHVQFYMENDRKRPRTQAKLLELSNPQVFRIVRRPASSWDYCTGQGRHEGKPALDRFSFGEPLLTETGDKADLKMLVGLIVEGTSPQEILKEHPYAYTVHRRRIWDLWFDIKAQDRLESSQEEWRGRFT